MCSAVGFDSRLPIAAGMYAIDVDGTGVFVESFVLDRLPVTVAAYRRFIEDDGYQMRPYWTEAGWQWRRQHQIEAPRIWAAHGHSNDGFFEKIPHHLLEQFTADDHPVVGVSLHEAKAYCEWAGVALPSAQQLIAAAVGPHGTYYPWGNAWDEQGVLAGIGNRADAPRVTPSVGQDPQSQGHFGHADLVGIVYQWTCDFYDDNRYMAFGGSWASPQAKCHARHVNGFLPAQRWTHVGFRTCAKM